jgi:hypothetical protein
MIFWKIPGRNLLLLYQNAPTSMAGTYIHTESMLIKLLGNVLGAVEQI